MKAAAVAKAAKQAELKAMEETMTASETALAKLRGELCPDCGVSSLGVSLL